MGSIRPMNATPPAPVAGPPAQSTPAPAVDAYPWGLYLHVIVVSLIGGFGVLVWFVLYEWLNKLIWDGSFVTDNAWMFPVICLPFSLLVGLLVKYAKAPSNLDGSILDSLTGDTSHLKWKDLPATIATSLASLFSGAVLGPEGAIGNIASKIAAMYCDLFRIPADRRPKLIFASVASGYNGLLENPVFAAVLGTEVAETKKQGLSTLPAALIGGGVGYGIFLLLHETGFVNFLHLPPVQDYTIWDAFLMVPLALIGLVLALLTAAFMKVSAGFFGRLKDRVVLRALVAGVIFSVVGVFAPVVMFSGETQVEDGHRRRRRLRHRAAAGDGGRQARPAQRGVQERVPRRADVPAHLRLDQRGAGAQPRLPGRAHRDLRRRHHDRRRLRAVPDPADGRPSHGVHAGRRPDHGGAHRPGHRHRDDRHASAAEAPGRTAGGEGGGEVRVSRTAMEPGQQTVVGKARWPMAAAVVAVIILTLLLPRTLIVRPRWGVPIAEALLLVAVIMGISGRSTGAPESANGRIMCR